jgi:hypothetical protein
MKIRYTEVEFFHVKRQKEGRTEKEKLIIAFRNFANVPKKG